MKPFILPLIFITAAITNVISQRDFSDVTITTEQVIDNIYMLQGSGGNIAILTGEDGTIMVDDQFAPLSDKIMAAIKDISDQSVHYLLNTHWHGDHTGGNENFANAGATIIAHDNVRKRLSTDNVRPFGRTTPAAPKAAWPQLTFNDEMHIHYNNENIHLIHNHNAHTDGDAFVYFSDSNVLHMGDCFFKDRFPFIDTELGGSPDGYIKAVSKAILITDTDTKILPGHGSLATKEDLLNFYSMLITMRDRVKKAISDGQSLEEALEANLTEGYESWGTGFINDEKIVMVLYGAYGE